MRPGYGQTPLPDDEAAWLQPQARDLLGASATLLDVYDLEQAVQDSTTAAQLIAIADGTLDISALLDDGYVRELHHLLYGDIWRWAGQLRRHEVNIGVAPEAIAVEVRQSLDTIAYRWAHTDDWTPHVAGIVVHAEVVRIHPFVDGNGRTTRLLADLVFAAAQHSASPRLFQWDLDKTEYIACLRRYDRTRDPSELAAFVATKPLGE